MRSVYLGTSELWVTYESPFVYVDTETQLDNAIRYGKSPVFRSMVPTTSQKNIVHEGTVWKAENDSSGIIATLDPDESANPAAIMIQANKTTLDGLKVTSTVTVEPSNPFFGIAFDTNVDAGHRSVLKNLEVYGWNRCLTKNGTHSAFYTDDISIEDCYFHSFSAYPLGAGVLLSGGLRRLNMRRCRIVGRVGAETHLTGNGMTLSTNVEDCVVEDVLIDEVDRMGFESLIESYVGSPTSENIRTTLRWVIAQNTGSYGISIAHGKGSYLEGCKTKDTVDYGIEIASQTDDPSWATLVSCEVDGVTGAAYAIGVSIDKCIETHLLGPIVKNIVSTTPDEGAGVRFYECEKCHVQAGMFIDAGDRYLYFHKGAGANTGGFHLAEGNEFRQSAAVAGRLAILVFDTHVAARNNTAFQKSGGGLGFVKNCNSPAGVRSENDVVTAFSPAQSAFDSTVTTGGFLSSNVIYTI